MINSLEIFKDEKNNCYQLRSKINSFAIEFDNTEKEEVFLKIVKHLQSNPETTLKKVLSTVSNPENEAMALDVLNTLKEYGLLPRNFSLDPEGKTDTKKSPYEINIRFIANSNLLLISGEEMQPYYMESLKTLGFAKLGKKLYSEIFDKDQMSKLIKDYDYILVDGNQWSPFHIEILNETALEQNKPWLYVGGVEEDSIKIGPLFYGKETGCYNCLISRIKSNMDFTNYLNSYEEYLRDNKLASPSDRLPQIEVIRTMLANMVSIEVAKFFEQWSLPVTWRGFIRMNIRTFEITKHDLLKKPFCEVCKPELEYNPAPWLEEITLK